MASKKGIMQLFAYLATIGLPAPILADKKRDGDIHSVTIEEIIDAWEVTMHDLPDAELLTAGVAYGQSGKFWPKPSEIRELCPSLKKAALSLAADNSLTGRDIWPSIVRQAGSIGRNCREWPQELATRLRLPEDRLRDAVDAAGGWLAICNSSHDAERASMGRRFAAAWSRQAEAKQADRLIDFASEARKRLEAKSGK